MNDQNPTVPPNVAQPQDFQKKRDRKGVPLTLPSGVTIMARRVNLTDFIRTGKVPNSLIPIVEEALKSGESSPEDIVNSDELSVESISEMYELMDDMAISAFISPKLHPVPDGEADRSEELLYVDEVEDQDKMHIFTWSQGKVEELKPFREESSAGMASVAEGPGSSPEASGNTGAPSS